MTRTKQTSETRLRAVSIALALATVLVPAVVGTGLAEAQTFTVLHSFTGYPDGEWPYAGLVQDAAGNLYGTTVWGGASDVGTVFKLAKTGEETVLHSFSGYPDGQYPFAGLVQDAAGSLYGTTEEGGAGAGTVFEVDKSGKETVLYSFTGTGGDGAYPWAGLTRDAKGNLYGTTDDGGAHGFGTVFELGKAGKEAVLYSFGGVYGEYPFAGLVRDAAGNLYGTTYEGGVYDYGTVFRLGKTGKETVLHSFDNNGSDGVSPLDGYLVVDAAGNLYGTTGYGGTSGYGTVFKLNKAGKETVLHSFTGGADGEGPSAGLVRDGKGNLYGTASWGGAYGYGTVFELTP